MADRRPTLNSRRQLLACATSAGVLGSAAVAAQDTPKSGREAMPSVKDFGARGDGRADDTEALQSAINSSYKEQNRAVLVPNGVYRISETIVVGQGVMLRGTGSQGSTDRYGTVFKHFSNEACFRFDGSGSAYAGTGGGLENFLIIKAAGYKGGNAIELVAISDQQRPGEMLLTNVLAYGESGGLWSHGLVVDGSACKTPGARGVRTVNCRKVRFADCASQHQSVVLNQATHFYAHGLAVDPGRGAEAGILVTGISDGIYLNGLACAGTFEVAANEGGNSTRNLHIDGKVGGSFINNDTEVDGTVALSGIGGLANKSRALKIIASKSPEFLAVRGSALQGATGDGTTAQLPFDAKVFDTLGSFGGKAFTCTVAGKYHFTLGVTYDKVGAEHTRSEISIVSTGQTRRAITDICNPAAMAASGSLTRSLSCTLDLGFGDTVSVSIRVSGGSRTVAIHGAAGVDLTWFSGKYSA